MLVWVFKDDRFQGSNVSVRHGRFHLISSVQNYEKFPANYLPRSTQMFSGSLLDEQTLEALHCLLVAIIFFSASVQAFDVFDLTPITYTNQLNVSTATKSYLTPKIFVAKCFVSTKSKGQTSFNG